MAYVIVGLGNPGEEYTNTRHNTGRIILEIAKKSFDDCSNWELDKKNKVLISKANAGGNLPAGRHGKVLLAMPDNFMNNSGGSIKSFIKSPKDAENLMVIHDDLDLAIGTMKISFNRGSGGHKGVESIIKNIKTEAFVRIRIGISTVTPGGKLKKPKGEKDVAKFILAEFRKSEMDLLKKIGKKVGDAIVTLITEGRGKAMSLYNQA